MRLGSTPSSRRRVNSGTQIRVQANGMTCGQAWLDGGEKVNSYLIVQERGAEHFQPRDCPKTFKRTAALIDVARARSGSSINAGFRRGCQMRLSLIAAM